MRGSPNRQTVSTTARWNLAQSDPASVGARKKPVRNQQTGQGTNIEGLKRALAAAELHLTQMYDPRLVQNMQHGIDLLKAQIARASGVDYNVIDLNTVPANVTGYQFAGNPESEDHSSTRIFEDGLDQSVISPIAAFQLAGTLRQQITKVVPHPNVTPAGFQKYIEDPQERSNVIRTPNNPCGSTFRTGKHDLSNLQTVDRITLPATRRYLQGFTPGTHRVDLAYMGAGIVPSYQDGPGIARGKHGQFKGGYQFGQGENA